MDEETRATAYRLQAGNRATWRTANVAALTPVATARNRIVAAWMPLIDALREKRYGRQQGPEAPDDRFNG